MSDQASNAVAIGFMPCENCGYPHDRRKPCGEAAGVEVVTQATIRNRARRRGGAKATFRLSRKAREELFAGGAPRITVPKGKSPFEPGDIYRVPGASNLSLRITGIEEGKDEDTLLYSIEDARARLLRARPHATDFEAIRKSFDAFGYPEEIDPAVAAQAAEESAYTTSPGASLRGEPAAISREDQEAMAKATKEGRIESLEQLIGQAEIFIGNMANDPEFAAGKESDLAYMQRKVVGWREELDRERAAA